MSAKARVSVALCVVAGVLYLIAGESASQGPGDSQTAVSGALASTNFSSSSLPKWRNDLVPIGKRKPNEIIERLLSRPHLDSRRSGTERVFEGSAGGSSVFSGEFLGNTPSWTEFQYIYSTQRQVVTSERSPGLVYFGWAGYEWPHAVTSAPFIQIWDSETESWAYTCQVGEEAGSVGANVTIDLTSDGVPVAAYQDWYSGSFVVTDTGACYALSVTQLVNLPDYSYHLFPRLVVQRGSSVTKQENDPTCDVFHVLTVAANGASSPPSRLLYHRFDACSGTWSDPTDMGTSNSLIVSLLFADRNSTRVVIGYLQPRSGDALDNDITYIESLDRGLSWIVSGPGSVHNVTQYQSSDRERATGDVSGGFTADGRLHLIWSAAFYDEGGGVYSDSRTTLRHWSEQAVGSNGPLGLSSTNIVAEAQWVPAGDLGVYSWNICRLSLAFGDGSTLCSSEGGPEANADYLYAVYTQFGSTDSLDLADTSSANYQNGNIYMSISRDGGSRWTPGICLTTTDSLGGTPTRSPGCSPMTPCLSENWPSVAEVVNDTLHLGYVGDYDPGVRTLGDSRSEWVPSDYLYLPVSGGTDGLLCLDCSGIGDMNVDQVLNILDVVSLVDVVFREGDTAYPLSRCDHPRGDVNCDYILNVFDLVRLVAHVFREGDPPCF